MKNWLVAVVTIALFGLVYSIGRADTIFIPFAPGGEGHAHVSSIQPYPTAPECTNHNPTKYHGLWNETDGCHFDHSHNHNPKGAGVVAVFGNYTDYTDIEVGFAWETWAGASPGYPPKPADPTLTEGHLKHPGYKFDFYDFPPAQYGCPVAQTGTKSVPNAWLIERHSLGNKADFMARIHSVWAAVRFCIPGTQEEAFLYTGGWQDFGQRISPYQGNIFPIHGSPSPTYPSPRSPYIAHACVNNAQCGGQNESNTSWISFAQMIPGHKLLGYGFRSNDSQQKVDATNGFNTPDPTFVYLCADAQGNYDPVGCMFNNSASHTYQLTGDIPAAYDLLDGVDDDRVNYEGYTDRWGNIAQGCTEIALDCVPVKMVNLPVGKYHVNVASYGLTGIHEDLPDYDLYFETTPSGWIGPSN